jgi:hypothetical protein
MKSLMKHAYRDWQGLWYATGRAVLLRLPSRHWQTHTQKLPTRSNDG